GLITGAGYTDVNATIPGMQILSVIAILVALLFIVTAFTGRWRCSAHGALFPPDGDLPVAERSL
ncbi:MAG: UPF0182 family protein, partial [Yersinia sp. (in: enterobacteria)]